jgi:tetratricopeptide (TPR) repeat protein
METNTKSIIQRAQTLISHGKLSYAKKILHVLKKRQPNEPILNFQLGYIFYLENQMNDAKYHLMLAFQYSPNIPGIMSLLVTVLQNLGDFEEAIYLLKRATIQNPNDPICIREYADLLHKQLKFHQSIYFNKIALMILPLDQKSLANIAESLSELQQNDQALSYIDEAIIRIPSSQQLKLNRAITLISLGRYEEGWEAYEARLSSDIADSPKRLINIPRWTGESLGTKTILVCSEQGVGDEILFSAYLSKLAAKAKHVIIEADPRLVTLFKRSFKNIEVHKYSRRVVGMRPIFDYGWVNRCKAKPDIYIDLASLPHFLHEKHETPLTTGQHLKDDVNLTKTWKQRLKKLSRNRPVIGLFWRSGLLNINRKHFYPPIKLWGPLLKIKNVCFVSLQFDQDSADIATVEQLFGTKILRLPDVDLRNDLNQTASICRALSGVIAPSTTTAHLSASVGTPTIVIDRTKIWSPSINGFDAIFPKIKYIYPPPDEEWDWVFNKTRCAVNKWVLEITPD